MFNSFRPSNSRAPFATGFPSSPTSFTVAEFAGSVQFVMMHVVWFTAWIAINIGLVPGVPRFDPFPFGLLTMVVSLEAIFLSVFVLLSQNRQAAKDRIRADIEYDVNLKAEREIGHLHEKVDRMYAEIVGRLAHAERDGAELPAAPRAPVARRR